jgi:hypothetical protein
MKSGNLNFLEPCGPLQTCNETAIILLCLQPERLIRGRRRFVDVVITKFIRVHGKIILKVGLKAVGWEDVRYFHVDEDKGRWRAL